MNNLSGSPCGMGFVYFNNSATSNDNSDFLEFNNSALSDNFSPGDCSSPRGKNWKQNRGKKQNRYYVNPIERHRNNSNNSFQNSPRNKSGNQRSFHHEKRDGPVDISSYLHPSMTENPWAELERINESNVGSSLQNETNESFSKLENDSESDFNICTDNEENPDTTTEISRD